MVVKNNLAQLQEKIARFKQLEQRPTYKKNDNISASRVCIELVAAVISGIVIGAILDDFMKTKLIFKIICLLLSCVAGFYSIYKLSRQK